MQEKNNNVQNCDSLSCNMTSFKLTMRFSNAISGLCFMYFWDNYFRYTGLHLFEQLWIKTNYFANRKCMYKLVCFDSLKALIVQTNASWCMWQIKRVSFVLSRAPDFANGARFQIKNACSSLFFLD